MNNQKITASNLRLAAMGYLSLREHSVKELYQKLSKRFSESVDLIGAVLIKLEQDDLQSDERFSEAFITMRIRQGKGPVLIAKELEVRGVSVSTINRQLKKSNADWWGLAQAVKSKRFGGEVASELKEKAKQIRFLTYRGFDPDIVSRIVSQ